MRRYLSRKQGSPSMREIMDSSDLNLVKVHGGGGYDSDFSDDEDTRGTSQHGKKRKHDELLQKPFQQGKHTKVAHKSLAAEEWDREEARNRRHHLISMNAFERHKKFVGDYIMYYGGKMTDFKRSMVNDKTDFDVVRENHRFLWREEDHEDMTWEKELAKKYYDKLFKEYCISDLSRYKENKFGFRWRTENEVVSGKGQFFCGNKRCEQKEGLKSWEVNFAYVEHGEKRNALVKLRLCPECSYKLNYHHKRKEFKAKKKIKAEVKKESKTGKSSRQKQRRRKSKEHSTTTSSEDSEDSNKDPESSEEAEAEEDEASSETDHWKGPAPSIEEKSKEEEFDDYFEDMFL